MGDKEVTPILLKLMEELGVIKGMLTGMTRANAATEKRLEAIENRLSCLEQKPSKRLDATVTAILSGVGGAIGGVILSKIIK